MAALLKFLCIFVLLVLVPACGDDRSPRAAPAQGAADQLAKDKAAQDQIAALRGDNDSKVKTIEEAKARIEANDYIILAAQESNKKLNVDIRNIVVEGRQAKLYWLSGILGFAALGLTVLAIFSPIERRELLLAAGVSAALATILLYVAELAAYFEAIGCGFLVLLVGALVIGLCVKSQVIHHLVTNWKAYAAKVPDEAKAALDQASVAAQPSHVKAFIDRLVARF